MWFKRQNKLWSLVFVPGRANNVAGIVNDNYGGACTKGTHLTNHGYPWCCRVVCLVFSKQKVEGDKNAVEVSEEMTRRSMQMTKRRMKRMKRKSIVVNSASLKQCMAFLCDFCGLAIALLFAVVVVIWNLGGNVDIMSFYKFLQFMYVYAVILLGTPNNYQNDYIIGTKIIFQLFIIQEVDLPHPLWRTHSLQRRLDMLRRLFCLIAQVYVQVLMIQYMDVLRGYTGVHKIE